MKNRLVLTCMALLAVGWVGTIMANYTGTLSTPEGAGLKGFGSWSTGITISWDVYYQSSKWWYNYTLNVDPTDKAISHIIIEVSDTSINIVDDVAHEDPVVYTSTSNGGSNPGLISDLTGIKWNTGSTENYTISFTTNRAPVWGDFYARDGQTTEQIGSGKDKETIKYDNYVYNAGFGYPDPDPILYPYNLEYDNSDIYGHILRPDTTCIVPAPAAIMLGSLGMGLVGWLRRRQSL